VAADDQDRFVAELVQKVGPGLQGLRGIKIEWIAPVRPRHLAGMMDQVTGDNGMFAL
jgi:hypothetical protein